MTTAGAAPATGGKVTPTPGQKGANMSTVCRVGQETVEEIVSRTQADMETGFWGQRLIRKKTNFDWGNSVNPFLNHSRNWILWSLTLMSKTRFYYLDKNGIISKSGNI